MGNAFGGTTSRYLPKYMPKAFVEEIGQEWQHLVENGCDAAKEAEGDRYMLLATATAQVKLTAREEDSDDSDEEDSNTVSISHDVIPAPWRIDKS
jgi:hypothetical protein